MHLSAPFSAALQDIPRGYHQLKGAMPLVKPFKIFTASEIINMHKFPLIYVIE